MIMGKSLSQQRYEVLSNRAIHRLKRGLPKWEPAHHYARKAPSASQDTALTTGEAVRPRR